MNDQLHRIDGPAVENSNGYKAWYLNDKRHRADGPAIEYSNGYKVWYLNGIRYSEQEYNIEINKSKDKVEHLELTVADIEKLLGKKVKIVK